MIHPNLPVLEAKLHDLRATKKPNDHLFVFPEKNGEISPVKAASAMLLEKKIDGEITVIMIKLIKDQSNKEEFVDKDLDNRRYDGIYSFPGGKRANPEENRSMAEAEMWSPALTLARELNEELPSLFSTIGKAWDFLNQEDTETQKNTSWNFGFPVLQFIHSIDESISEKVNQGIDDPSLVQSQEVAKITRVALSAIIQSFDGNHWSKEGFQERNNRIREAKKNGAVADLSGFQQYQTNLDVKDSQGNTISLADYNARSLFLEIEKLKQISQNFFAS